MVANTSRLSAAPFVGVLVLAIAAYVAATLLAPSEASTMRFNISEAQLRLIQLTVILPVILAWMAAAFGAFRIWQYGEMIGDSEEGGPFRLLGQGLTVLLAGLIIPSLIGTLRPYHYDDPETLKVIQILVNYLYMIIPFIGFTLLYRSSRDFLKIGKLKVSQGSRVMLTAVIALIVAGLVLLILGDEYRGATPDPRKYTSYYLPDALIFLTLVLPYAILWWIGAQTALNLGAYRKNVPGILYRHFFKRIFWGTAAVVGFSIFLQFFTAASPALGTMGLGSILAVVYLLLIFYAVGYVFVARGAQKLKQIEEV